MNINDGLELRGIDFIAAERGRQIGQEGYDSAHDDEHVHAEIARAAACYAMPEDLREDGMVTLDGRSPWMWPWSMAYWKPTPEDRIKELAKAGALCAAEIDRLLRLRCSQPGGDL